MTEQGRGLADFDRSSLGPYWIDLARFGVSITLAAHQRGWAARSDALVGEFLASYRAALLHPAYRVPEPAVAAWVQARFSPDHAAVVEELRRETTPLDFDPAIAEPALARYAAAVLSARPELPGHFFDRVAMHRLHVGVDNPLNEKYLIRVEGRTRERGDDVLLIAKELRPFHGVDCVDVSRRADPLRVPVVELRAPYQPTRYAGYGRWRGKMFWIEAWEDSYAEIDITWTLGSAEDLRELAIDSGVQLGHAHPQQVATQMETRLRSDLLPAFDRDRLAIQEAVRDLAREAIQAWEHFRREAATSTVASRD